ncbi:DUF4397 domain-containing protein [Halobacterium litoreum]|uniref:DUF4397 domain-containing protein n=1 Tax=Halobacterium litoreum TaxID=2039234 RepID=A0ABD5NC18_9EURY|nr:DUF4397 domain-containing protein [Halobacterium litoreum]UHH14474.1 DUF4397 domain-containing protein [Halobacterium litoreum]
MQLELSRTLTAVLLAALVAGAVATTGALAASAAETAENPQNVAYLNVAHASPDAPAVDVYVDNETALEDFAFGDVSDYLELDAGAHTVAITVADDRSAVVFEGNLTLERGTATTVAAAGEVSENGTTAFAPRVFPNDALTPDNDYAAVRVAHLSPDAPTVDVTAEDGDVVLAENVSFGNASAYVTVPAGDYEVEIRADTPNADGPVVATVDVSLDDEEAYTAWAVGYASPDDAPADTPFEVILTEDASVTVELP